MALTGREERARSKRGRDRKPNLSRVYRGRRWEGVPGEFDFEFYLLRGRGSVALKLGRSVESVEWVDEQATLQGSISLRRPIPDDPRSLPVGRGHQIRCRVRPSGTTRWNELWVMRVQSPDIDPATGIVNVNLLDDLDIVRRNQRDWSLRKSKARPHGWGVREAAEYVCRTEGIPVRFLADGSARISNLRRHDTSALDMLRMIYAKEREASGRRFIVRWVRGAVEVRAYERNRILYAFEEQLLSALLSQVGSARPFTVIMGRGHVGKGKAARVVRHTEVSREAVRRFGRAVSRRSYGRVDSEAELRRKVQRDYAWALRVRHRASITVPGIPWIRRGMGCELRLPAEGYGGEDAFVFTTRVTHRIDAAGYVVELDVNRVDPFVRDTARRESELRAIKRRERRRHRQATG